MIIQEKNKWKIVTIILLVVIICLGRIIFNDWLVDNAKLDPKLMCGQIEGTPAWIENGQIIDYGFKSISVDELIKHRTYFFYSSNCGWCHKQIESWGEEDWDRLQDEGLTVNCVEVIK